MITVVVGGTSGLGLEVARHRSDLGDEVILTGRDPGTAARWRRPGDARAVALELTEPPGIAAALAGIERVDNLVLAAIERDTNDVRAYDLDRALNLVTLKLVGYSEVVHALSPAMHDDTAIVVFGGRAKDRPYPGSMTVSTVNGGVIGMVNALALELAPIRVNAIHPGIVGDSPFWAASRTRCSRVSARGRRPAGSRRWPTSWVPSISC